MNLTDLVRARIIAEGDVQKVGYRDLVQSMATSLGVKGFVENLKNGSVQIVCETQEEALKKFIKKIKVEEDFIRVKKVQVVETSTATGEFEYFDIKYGPLEYELGEALGPLIKYAGAILEDIRNMHRELNAMRTDPKEATAGIRGSI